MSMSMNSNCLAVFGDGTYAAQYRIFGGPIRLVLVTVRLWVRGDG